MDVPQPNSTILTRTYGTNNEGDDSPNSTTGSPTLSGDWVTFDGNDGYVYSSGLPESTIEGRIKFRIEQDFYNINSTQCIWKSGGSNGIGFGIRVDNTNNILNIGINGNTTTHLELPLYVLEKNTWYTSYWSKERITILEENDDTVSYTASGNITVSNGSLSESAGYAYSASPIGGVAGQYFIGSIKSVDIWSDDDMAWPNTSNEPTSIPFHRIIFGSDNDGLISNYYTQEGSPINNTDNVEFNGISDGLYTNSATVEYGSIDIACKVSFSVDDFSGTQVLYKIGGNSNGFAIGIDSNNIGLFGRSGDLTSITVPTSALTTSTKYNLYSTNSELKIYNENLSSIIVSASGTLTIGSGSDDESVGYANIQDPLSGDGTDSSFFNGKIYEVCIYNESDFEFPSASTTSNVILNTELQTLSLTQFGSTIYSETNIDILVNLLNKSLTQFGSTVDKETLINLNLLNKTINLYTSTILTETSVSVNLNLQTLNLNLPSASIYIDSNVYLNLNILQQQMLINSVTLGIVNRILFPIIDGVNYSFEFKDDNSSITKGIDKINGNEPLKSGLDKTYSPTQFIKGIEIVKR